MIQTSDLYKHNLYTKPIMYAINEIYEYDIAKANISILLDKGMITQNDYNMYLQMPKINREIAIGNLQKQPVYSKALSEGFEWSRKCLIESNSLTDDDILSIKKDAMYVFKKLHHTRFGNIEFTLRGMYHMYIKCGNLEIYYSMNEIDDSGDIIDIKGINDSKLELHSAYLSFLTYILKMVIKNNTKGAITELLSFMNKYDNRELPIDYYRELNAESMFSLNKYGVMFIDESYKPVIEIGYNQLFNRELFKILMTIQHKR